MPKNFRAKINRNKRGTSSSRNARYNSYARPTQQGTGQAQNAMNETISQKVITAEKNRGGSRDRENAYRDDRDRGGTQNVDKNDRDGFTHDNSHVVCWFCNRQGHTKQKCHSYAANQIGNFQKNNQKNVQNFSTSSQS